MTNDTTALYIRLSEDDGGDRESNSVVNQRDLLTGYVNGHPVLSKTKVIEFADDGWSGTNFQRPGVEEMLEAVRAGRINCVVVKDLSRFGRNYVEVCKYLDQIFPFLGVRFISVNDNYDSQAHAGRTAPLDVAFSSMLHNLYSKDLSRKVRQSYTAKAAKGEFLCGVAPFGYVRSKTERNKLVIDAEAAATVRRIFKLAGEGFKTTEIAAVLNRERADTPLGYRRKKGLALRGDHSAVREDNLWMDNNVRRILTDERYTGVQVSGKTVKKCVGSPRSVPLPESEWIRAENAHEPVVSREVFDRAQAVVRRFHKTTAEKRRSMFAGKIKCGHCGHALDLCNSKDPYYVCYAGRLTEESRCFDGRLYVRDLKEYVLSAVKTEIKKALDVRQKRLRDMKRKTQAVNNGLNEAKKLASQCEQTRRRIFALYEDYADSKISMDEYSALKAKWSKDIEQAEARIAELNRRLDSGDKREQADDIPLLRRILDAGDVTKEMAGLIDRIVVYNAEHMEICFTFGDVLHDGKRGTNE